jgi:hypothetical protein
MQSRQCVVDEDGGQAALRHRIRGSAILVKAGGFLIGLPRFVQVRIDDEKIMVQMQFLNLGKGCGGG